MTPPLRIVSATYGPRDVTEILREMVEDHPRGWLFIPSRGVDVNDLFDGDPAPNLPKTLTIEYELAPPSKAGDAERRRVASFREQGHRLARDVLLGPEEEEDPSSSAAFEEAMETARRLRHERRERQLRRAAEGDGEGDSAGGAGRGAPRGGAGGWGAVAAKAGLEGGGGAPPEGVVYTCVTGAHDGLQRPERPNPRWLYVCFTDHPRVVGSASGGDDRAGEVHEGWSMLPIPAAVSSAVRRACPCADGDAAPRSHRVKLARFVKMLGWTALPADRSLWADASFRLTGDPSELWENLMERRGNGEADLAVHRHPERKSVRAEAECCSRVFPGEAPAIGAQLRHNVETLGFPDSLGLPATGLLWRRRSAPLLEMSLRWWNQVCAWSTRDQLSFSVAAWQTPEIRVNYLQRSALAFSSTRYAVRDDVPVRRRAGRRDAREMFQGETADPPAASTSAEKA